MDQSKNKDVAFKVLSEMVVDKQLPVIYGGMPAKEADRPDFFAALDKKARTEQDRLERGRSDAQVPRPAQS